MKKILFATALIGFAFMQVNAQNPAATTAKPSPATAKVGDPAPVAKPAANAAKPAKVASASVKKGKPVKTKRVNHGAKVSAVAKDNKGEVKPVAPGTEDKK